MVKVIPTHGLVRSGTSIPRAAVCAEEQEELRATSSKTTSAYLSQGALGSLCHTGALLAVRR